MTMVPGHGESLLPPGKRWQLVWHDEFEGSELDRSKWMFRKHLFHRQHETFTDEGVFLDGNSNLHITLLEKEIIILEGLRLAHVEPGRYLLIALPVKIADADGAPTRAVLLEGELPKA